MGPYAPFGVVDDRRGWPGWPTWFKTSLFVIWSNFCVQIVALKALFGNCVKILLSGTCHILQGFNWKEKFLLQNFKILVIFNSKNASESLLVLQEALRMTSNMAIFVKTSTLDPVGPLHLGVPISFLVYLGHIWYPFQWSKSWHTCITIMSNKWHCCRY